MNVYINTDVNRLTCCWYLSEFHQGWPLYCIVHFNNIHHIHSKPVLEQAKSVTKYSSFDSEIRKLSHSNLQTKKIANKKTIKLRFTQKLQSEIQNNWKNFFEKRWAFFFSSNFLTLRHSSCSNRIRTTSAKDLILPGYVASSFTAWY